MNKSRLLGAVCAVLLSLITMPTNAALVGRLPATPGGTDFQAAYDTVLDITWVTNAALSGTGHWPDLVAWASNLNYLGFDDWRLATVSVQAGLPTGTVPDAGGSAFIVNCSTASELDCRDNELGYMYYQNLGGNGNNLTGNHTAGDVTLTGIQSSYWSGVKVDCCENFSNPIAWGFGFLFGTQGTICDNCTTAGWAVRSGDIAAVPIPAAVWLFGSGLLGLIGLARRRK